MKLAKISDLGYSETGKKYVGSKMSDFADLSEIGPGFSRFPTLSRYEITGFPQSEDAP